MTLSLSSASLAAALVLGLTAPVLALEVSRCRALRQERDALATQAMAAELTLVRQVRERICGPLTRQAEQANANQPPPAVGAAEPATDYRALLHCRQQSEQLLIASHPVLYRNRLGFIYYTRTGASLARRADGLERSLLAEACPAWLRGEPEPASTPPR
ncbi:MAG: hypothetical protein WCI65_02395 [Synechococcaceae cyanobacterium ELA263]